MGDGKVDSAQPGCPGGRKRGEDRGFMSLVIDGHNLIGALPGIDLGERADEERLISRLRAARARVGGRSMVVFFDSGPLPGQGPDLSTNGIQVHFAALGQTADDAIVQYLRERSAPGQHAVVTNDRELAARVRSLGAKVIAAGDFVARLTQQREGPTEQLDQLLDPHSPAFADIYEQFLRGETKVPASSRVAQSQIRKWSAQVYGDDPAEAELAVKQLAQYARSSASDVLRDALTHSAPRVRAAALLELGMLRNADALPAMAQLLATDPVAMVREAAAQSLGWAGDRKVLPDLEAAAEKDSKSRVRKAASAAAAQIRGRRS